MGAMVKFALGGNVPVYALGASTRRFVDVSVVCERLLGGINRTTLTRFAADEFKPYDNNNNNTGDREVDEKYDTIVSGYLMFQDEQLVYSKRETGGVGHLIDLLVVYVYIRGRCFELARWVKNRITPVVSNEDIDEVLASSNFKKNGVVNVRLAASLVSLMKHGTQQEVKDDTEAYSLLLCWCQPTTIMPPELRSVHDAAPLTNTGSTITATISVNGPLGVYMGLDMDKLMEALGDKPLQSLRPSMSACVRSMYQQAHENERISVLLDAKRKLEHILSRVNAQLGGAPPSPVHEVQVVKRRRITQSL
jgi:hypothetical protein